MSEKHQFKVYLDQKTVFVNGKAEKQGNSYLVIETPSLNKDFRVNFDKSSAELIFKAFEQFHKNETTKCIANQDFLIEKKRRKSFNPTTFLKEDNGSIYYVLQNIREQKVIIPEENEKDFLNQLAVIFKTK